MDHILVYLQWLWFEVKEWTNHTLMWGTYRPNLYFGVRPRLPHSLLTSLAWFGVTDFEQWQNIRHACSMDDKIKGYGYHVHDGRSFGEQTIRDTSNNVLITTDFIKPADGEGWSARISGRPIDKSRDADISLVYLIGLDAEEGGELYLADSAAESSSQDHSPPLIGEAIQFHGHTPDLGEFTLTVEGDPTNQAATLSAGRTLPGGVDPDRVVVVGVQVPDHQLWQGKEVIDQLLLRQVQSRVDPQGRTAYLPPYLLRLPQLQAPDANSYLLQYTLRAPFTLRVRFAPRESETPPPLAPLATEQETQIKALTTQFTRRFTRTFHLDTKQFTEAQIKIGQDALSNLLGGIGYFYGNQMVTDDHRGRPWDVPEQMNDGDSDDDDDDDDRDADDENEDDNNASHEFRAPKTNEYRLTPPSALFSSTPSRSFFPRGFLWDEGFLQLLVGAWDTDLSLEIIQHWTNAIDADGWVAREQILGPEARSKVPPEFQVQNTAFANPPTLLFPIMAFVKRLAIYHSTPPPFPPVLSARPLQGWGGSGVVPAAVAEVWASAMPREYNRFVTDAALGPELLEHIFPALQRQFEWSVNLNPGARRLPSPSASYRAAYRWRGRTLNHTLTSGLDDYPRATPHRGELHVDLMSWMGYMSRSLMTISDMLGRSEDQLEYQTVHEHILANLDTLHWNPNRQMYCDVTVVEDDNDDAGVDPRDIMTTDNDESPSVLVCHRGYLSLFPLALGLLPPSSPKLGALLNMIHDPRQLWSPYGVRSLAKSDPNYDTGENYWRGAVWLNLNYLVLAGLHTYYRDPPGPYRAQANVIYEALRTNVVNNVLKQYRKTGFFWEQYSAKTGAGLRAHPFTGWTSLVLLIMAEKYD
ncbi:glycoside hydrolase [Dimargaris cristalligena]|uniref:Mannosyl-oligosaccharide glucosidase n=1 Tax=Dimargaris cristalligena TaxID=215637 RepID=A0A4P9ZU69_9FUNG|nr:glycoside hydrolase [Dimargaris cristalligena]|eukprot:RKP36401.1 glycoside hydrolase [Dimargaris cristalligena]